MENQFNENSKVREGEKGVALVMALLITSFLIVASAGLLLESSFNTYNVTDATSEQQAYNAAESGLQAAVYVLRDNVTLPDSLRLDTTKPATDKANRITYRRALTLTSSNLTSTGLDTTPRLSRWLTYNTTNPDRIVMGGATSFTNNGYAFNLQLSDPDHTGQTVQIATIGRFNPQDVGNPSRITYGNLTNGYVIEFVPKAITRIDTTNGGLDFANTDYGSFRSNTIRYRSLGSVK